MKNKRILFNDPLFLNSQFQKNLSILKQKSNFSSLGYFTKKCKKWLAHNLDCKNVFLVHSCTAALEMTALLLNIKKGDEIIMPSYTFVSSANAFALRGGKPVFVDTHSNNCNIDPNKIQASITKKTKAILVVHYAGFSCDMDKILKIAKKYKLFVIEDAAQSILSTYKNRKLGSIGDLATISFHETKNIHCGQGGALLINNERFVKRANILLEKGTNRYLHRNNLIKKYTWVDLGSSFTLNEINAAYLYTQLVKAKKITNQRKKIYDHYNKKFEILEKKGLLLRPRIPSYNKANYHIYYIFILKKKRDDLISYLKSKKISALFHYIPLHKSKYGKHNGMTKFSMKNTDWISSKILRLPFHHQIKKEDINKIFNEIFLFYKK